jgi:uncharacterized FAD-dependent dehydrogenase
MSINPVAYRLPHPVEGAKNPSPIVVGSGPAGLFCAYILALAGARPILLERGDEAAVRKERVDTFWRGGTLDPESNVQFGEGGAGTFSDGKLNTGVHDKSGRGMFVLETFVKMGAPGDILYDAKPHVGTDHLVRVVSSLREEIRKLGGNVRFRTRVEQLLIRDGRVTGVLTSSGERIESGAVVLAIGHSARDTFSMLASLRVPMERKPFAVGLRVEHPQELINRSQYGADVVPAAGPAPYKLTHRCADGRGVYSFCMCPGGYVVNASSEPGMLAINGMSNRAREGMNANSAIVVTVGPEDFHALCEEKEAESVLSGMYFQRQLERRAFALRSGAVPVQRLADFRRGAEGGIGSVSPQIMGSFAPANTRELFPEAIAASIDEGMHAFGRKIRGFDDDDALFSAVESRTSSPIRILRDAGGQSEIRGLYPCGEGAGYAGGITSAAIDGIRTAEKVLEFSYT